MDLENYLNRHQILFDIDLFPGSRFQVDDAGVLRYSPKPRCLLYVTKLGLAAAQGWHPEVQSLLQQEPVDSQHEDGSATPLFLALCHSHTDTAIQLLVKGAQPDTPPAYNALHAAARNGLHYMITFFVRYMGVDPNVEDIDGAVPMVYALLLPLNKALETVALLIELGARTDTLIANSPWGFVDVARAINGEVALDTLTEVSNTIHGELARALLGELARAIHGEGIGLGMQGP